MFLPVMRVKHLVKCKKTIIEASSEQEFSVCHLSVMKSVPLPHQTFTSFPESHPLI